MSPSIEAILALIEGDVPERLISSHTFVALQSVCRHLPIYFSSGFGFESRLAEKSAEVDLIVRTPAPRGLEILAGKSRSCRLPDFFFEDVSWERLRSLALECQTWPRRLREAVLNVWLEFDADQFGNPVPSPGLLFLQIGKLDPSRDDCNQIARTAYAIIRNRPVNSELAYALETCLNKLPHHGVILHVGLGISRPTEAMRLVLADLTHEDISQYLSATKWPGDLRQIDSLFRYLDRYTHQFILNIDMLAAVCPRIGIECSIGGEESSTVGLGWTDFLDFITGMGWCLPEKSAGLLAWSGRNLFQAGSDSWPWVVERFLNHIKISYDVVSGVEAKAYFGLAWRHASAGSSPRLRVKDRACTQGTTVDDISSTRSTSRMIVRNFHGEQVGMAAPGGLRDSCLSDCLTRAAHFLWENQRRSGEFRSVRGPG